MIEANFPWQLGESGDKPFNSLTSWIREIGFLGFYGQIGGWVVGGYLYIVLYLQKVLLLLLI